MAGRLCLAVVSTMILITECGAVPSQSQCTPPTTFGQVTLPGIPPNTSWAGYVQVSASTSLFYHLSEATAPHQPTSGAGGATATGATPTPGSLTRPPLVVWSNGGPGASSVQFGDFLQNVGPFHVASTPSGLVAQLNPTAIATDFATLFIDHPSPTGLSIFCAEHANGAGPAGTQEANAAQYVETMRQVLSRHADFADRDIYLAGESYAGRFLPAIATAARSTDPDGVGRALKGLMIGNGEVDAAAAFASYGPFLFINGFISERQRDELAAVSETCTQLVAEQNWTGATQVCYTIRSLVSQWTGPGSFFDEDIRSGTDPFAAEMGLVGRFLDQADTRAALHAAPLSLKPSVADGGRAAWTAFNGTGDFAKSAVPLVSELIEAGVKVLLYTGVFDEVMNVLSTAKWLPTLQWNGTAAFLKLDRAPVYSNGSVVAYHRQLGPLSQLHILRAGHFATKQQPDVLREAFARFIFGA